MLMRCLIFLVFLLASFEVQAQGLPKNYRSSCTHFKFAIGHYPTREGLDGLKISGSGQFSLEELKCLRQVLSRACIIVDLREESHELNGLEEAKIVEDCGFGYFRLGIPDGGIPTPYQVDEFIGFVKNRDPEIWLHFHCAAGRGRTTTFLAMYDMMHNAKKVSFEDIIRRQYLIGGMNLFKQPKKEKEDKAYKRLLFLKQFYKYCHDNELFDCIEKRSFVQIDNGF